MIWQISPALLCIAAQVFCPTSASGRRVASSALTRTVTFAGSVSIAHPFERRIRNHLTFRLNPSRAFDRWVIWEGDPAEASANYGAVVRPPFRGPEDLYIHGRHF